jgi:hypothetical protein
MFPGGDRSGNAGRRTPGVYTGEESDRAVLPLNPPNKEAQAWAEVAEGMARVKESIGLPHTRPTQRGIMSVPGADRCAVGGVAPAVTIQHKSRMRWCRPYGSARGRSAMSVPTATPS